MNAAKRVIIRTRLNDSLNRIANKGKDKDANNEAREMIRLKIKTTNQIKITIPRIIFKPGIFRESPIKTPNVVATPLPPLKFKKSVQLCPQIALTPISIQNVSRGILAL